jgi:hypothetical protein
VEDHVDRLHVLPWGENFVLNIAFLSYFFRFCRLTAGCFLLGR